MVWVPPQALRRVMTNLIDNALKFGTTATVTLTRDAVGDITLHVLDEGPGIPEASLQEVLQPFYRRRTRAIAIPAAPAWGWRSPRSWSARWTARCAGQPPAGRPGRQRSPCRGGIVSCCISGKDG
nr:Sensor kinase protein RcsC [Klebsiella pneumoniae]